MRRDREADRLEDYRGLFWRRPRMATVLMLALLSLAGIPLTVGFIGKFYLFAAGAAGEQWFLLWVLVAGSAIGLYYYLRVLLVLLDTGERGALASTETIPLTPGRVTLGVLAILMVWLGVFPGSVMHFINAAIRGMV